MSKMNEDEYGVHRTHCCVIHGCKYGNEECPVANEIIKQDYLCEYCGDHNSDIGWKDIKKERPIDNGSIQNLLVVRDTRTASSGNCCIETCLYTNRFEKENHITHWMPLPQKPIEYLLKII